MCPAIYAFTLWQHFQRDDQSLQFSKALKVIQANQVFAVIGPTEFYSADWTRGHHFNQQNALLETA